MDLSYGSDRTCDHDVDWIVDALITCVSETRPGEPKVEPASPNQQQLHEVEVITLDDESDEDFEFKARGCIMASEQKSLSQLVSEVLDEFRDVALDQPPAPAAAARSEKFEPVFEGPATRLSSRNQSHLQSTGNPSLSSSPFSPYSPLRSYTPGNTQPAPPPPWMAALASSSSAAPSSFQASTAAGSSPFVASRPVIPLPNVGAKTRPGYMCQICDLPWYKSPAELLEHIWTHFRHKAPTNGDLWFLDIDNCSVPDNFPDGF